MPQKISRATIRLTDPPAIVGAAAVGGKKESEGPLAQYYDILYQDSELGEKTWEKAENKLQRDALNKALEKARLPAADIDFLFAGDLLNQCIGSTYGLREFGIPFFGVYGACSTMAESLALASLFVDSGMATRTAAVTSSHFCAAERQFRLPLEYGGQRTPTSQWTATASGAAVVAHSEKGPFVKELCVGKIVDMGITDANNMGAAMAPAAYDTIKTFLEDTDSAPTDYDLILTGDLGQVGTRALTELLRKDRIDISAQHKDCGLLIYDRSRQDVHAGGSGCGCSASVLCGYILRELAAERLHEVLFIATGALMSPTALQQGESIPGIAHLIHLSSAK